MVDQASNPDDRLQCATVTDIGMRRSANQDSHVVVLARDEDTWQQRGHFFMVADGMGAHAAGELASLMAVERVPHFYHKYDTLSPPEALAKALTEANGEVHRRGQENNEFHNMGTTASVMALLPQGALIAHIGDSRIYRWRRGKLEQLTFDHSLVWELRDAGQLPKDAELAGAIPKNVITRFAGAELDRRGRYRGPAAHTSGRRVPAVQRRADRTK